MRLVLSQTFPLGRFHATPWRVNPFDDPYGEWPPSPWRFVRAVTARWYQWQREVGDQKEEKQLDDLVRALCDCSYRFHLPIHARRGTFLRQYHPVEFGWNPSPKKNDKTGMRSYGTSLTQDNFWCVPTDDLAGVLWFVEGKRWEPRLVQALDCCIERITYFGRAESFTRIRRIDGAVPEANCEILDRPASANAIRVLVPDRDATRTKIEGTSEDPLLSRSVPEGARAMYATLPPRPETREAPMRIRPRSDCHLIQLAIGWAVPPEPRAIVRLTTHFRSAVLRQLLLLKTGDPKKATWSKAGPLVRTAIADMTGKDAEGRPHKEHRHAEFVAWWDGLTPTRLLVWRDARKAPPFDDDEQAAILKAAARELSWSVAGTAADAWKIKLVPLDTAVPPPPGFDGAPAKTWKSLTPYVPPRHHLRGAKPRASESIESQIRRELVLRGVPNGEQVKVVEISHPAWVNVHLPRREVMERLTIGDRRGYWLQLEFEEPIVGPLRVGHSSSFGLGLFAPATMLANADHIREKSDET